MDIPDFVRTEWKSRGCVDLYFSSPDRIQIQKSNERKSDKFIEEEIFEDKVTLTISTFNVWEYKEKFDDCNLDSESKEVQKINKDWNRPYRSIDEESVNQFDRINGDLFSISKEIMNEWNSYWSNWGDTLVQLAWVHKYRVLCEEDYINWHDEYVANSTVQCLSRINYCLDLPLNAEEYIEKIKEDPDRNKENYDALYKEFCSKRYMVHFRLFIKDANIKVHIDLEDFFFSHGIVEEPPADTKEECYIVESGHQKNEVNMVVDKSADILNTSLQEINNFVGNGKNINTKVVDNNDVTDIKSVADDLITEKEIVFDYQNDIGVDQFQSDGIFSSIENETDVISNCNRIFEHIDDYKIILNKDNIELEPTSSTEDADILYKDRDTIIKEDDEQFIGFDDDSGIEISKSDNKSYPELCVKKETEDFHHIDVDGEEFTILNADMTGNVDNDHVKSTITNVDCISNDEDIDVILYTGVNKNCDSTNNNNTSDSSLTIGSIKFLESDIVDSNSGVTINVKTADNVVGNDELDSQKGSSVEEIVPSTICNQDSVFQKIISHEIEKVVAEEQIGDYASSFAEAKLNRIKNKQSGIGGVGWALERLHQLGEGVNHWDSHKNEPFIFGTKVELKNKGDIFKCKDESDLGERQDSRDLSNSEETLLSSESSFRKRKREDYSESDDCEEEISEPPLEESGFAMKVYSGFWKFFGSVFTAVFMRVSSIDLEYYPQVCKAIDFVACLFPGYRARKFEEARNEWRMKRAKKTLSLFKKWLKPTVRNFPRDIVSLDKDNKLMKVEKGTDERLIKEELAQIYFDGEGDANGGKGGMYVQYLTEDDYDEMLEYSSGEAYWNEPEVEPQLRYHTIFDDEGNPQQVRKVPVEDGKVRCSEVLNKGSNDKPNCDIIQPIEISFEPDGNFHVKMEENEDEMSLHQKITLILNKYSMVRFNTKYGPTDNTIKVDTSIDESLYKYWIQRYRLFLRFDEGIRLDNESWYSVTPEMLAAHQAQRCQCDVIIDAFCGAGGNAIQLSATCSKVIAIDVDPKKIDIAKHNASIYGVADRIEFITGDFFALAPGLKADGVFLSPPWGGVGYYQGNDFDVYKMANIMDGRDMFKTALNISSNIAIYLPKNSNIYQIIDLAKEHDERIVDIEFNHISNKRKSLTAYYGNFVHF